MNSEFQIPFVDFGGEGEVIHFAHANGFPPMTYQSLIDNLTSEYRVLAMELRPLWPGSDYGSFKNWESAADDVIRFLDQQKLSGIIGIGHSFGGILTLIASIKRPDLFKKIVLIEPVILPTWVYVMTRFLPKYLLQKTNPVAKQTLARTNKWKNKQAAFEQFRSKRVFAKIADKELWDYVNAAVVPSGNNDFELRFKREWEAQIYMTFSPPWKFIQALKIPHLILRGETSDTIRDEVWQKLNRVNQKGALIQFNDLGHLLPLEDPDKTANSILDFLKKS